MEEKKEELCCVREKERKSCSPIPPPCVCHIRPQSPPPFSLSTFGNFCTKPAALFSLSPLVILRWLCSSSEEEEAETEPTSTSPPAAATQSHIFSGQLSDLLPSLSISKGGGRRENLLARILSSRKRIHCIGFFITTHMVILTCLKICAYGRNNVYFCH